MTRRKYFLTKGRSMGSRYVKEAALDGSKKYGSVYAKTYHEVKAKQQFRINQPFGSVRKSTATVDDVLQDL